MNIIIYYINLDGRKDKKNHAEALLTDQPFSFMRVPAISYLDLNNLTSFYLYKKITTAVKSSHLRACENLLFSENEFALILEDDFKFRSNRIEKNLKFAVSEMKRKNINFLQMGFLKFGEARKDLPIVKKLFFTIFEFSLFILSYVRNPISSIVIGNIRWGAQAYLIDRHAAKELIEKLDKYNEDPIDLAYKKLSKGQPINSIKMARLKRNIIWQNQTFRSDSQNIDF
jgi:GR25 family glycosyltransferase involved in LPS biosynthesis